MPGECALRPRRRDSQSQVDGSSLVEAWHQTNALGPDHPPQPQFAPNETLRAEGIAAMHFTETPVAGAWIIDFTLYAGLPGCCDMPISSSTWRGQADALKTVPATLMIWCGRYGDWGFMWTRALMRSYTWRDRPTSRLDPCWPVLPRAVFTRLACTRPKLKWGPWIGTRA
jgi:hypothetical protein